MTEVLTGRRRVRHILIDPLIAMGLQRKRSMSVADFEAMQTRLADQLSYASDQTLLGLKDFIVRASGTGTKAAWPAEALIVRSAWNIETPPPRENNYARSLIRSKMGRRAFSEGWAVELFQIAKRLGPPPNKYIIHRLKEEADDNSRRRARIAEYKQTGRATVDDLEWLNQWEEDSRECLSILSEASETAQ